MGETIEVIYENGVFKPLKKVEIKDRSKGLVVLKRSIVDEVADILQVSDAEVKRVFENLDNGEGIY
jgi:predicted DNA-binding antitoxin AbrB/MazE fold protein